MDWLRHRIFQCLNAALKGFNLAHDLDLIIRQILNHFRQPVRVLAVRVFYELGRLSFRNWRQRRHGIELSMGLPRRSGVFADHAHGDRDGNSGRRNRQVSAEIQRDSLQFGSVKDWETADKVCENSWGTAS